MPELKTNQQIQKDYGPIVSKTRVAKPGLKIADFVPEPGHIVVKVLPPDETEGSLGIIVKPEAYREPKSYAWVVRVNPGDDRFDDGDLVLFDQGAGTEVNIDGIDYRILLYDDEASEILGRWPAKLFPQNNTLN